MNGISYAAFITPNQPPGKLGTVSVHIHADAPMIDCLRQLSAALRERAQDQDVWLADGLLEILDIAALLDGIQIVEFGVWFAPDNPNRRYVTFPSRISMTGGRHYVPLVKEISVGSGAKARLEKAILDAFAAWEAQQQTEQAAVRGRDRQKMLSAQPCGCDPGAGHACDEFPTCAYGKAAWQNRHCSYETHQEIATTSKFKACPGCGIPLNAFLQAFAHG